MNIYFETSAVNFLFEHLSIENAIQMKGHQRARGINWKLSPITLWEILLTSDSLHKEKIIFFAQNLFHENLLPSPEELLISYMEQGCPIHEEYRELYSTIPIAKTWTDLCRNKDKTFVYSFEQLKNKKDALVKISRELHYLSKTPDSILSSPFAVEPDIERTLDSCVSDLSWIKRGEPVSLEERKAYKVSIYLILIILGAGIGLNNEPIEEFWSKRKMQSSLARLTHLLKKYEILASQGPLFLMAIMLIEQSQGKFSRGSFLDGLHTFYVPYVDKFCSEDKHFSQLQVCLGMHQNASKFFKPSEMFKKPSGV